jgi:hypothetical protein
VALARGDGRVSDGAAAGSAAVAGEDYRSDIDLSAGIAAGVEPEAVLAEWTERLTGAGAEHVTRNASDASQSEAGQEPNGEHGDERRGHRPDAERHRREG